MITLLDGAVGTSLWEKCEKHGLEKVPVWRLNIEHPELVLELHNEMIEAGAKIILANTFGANRFMVEKNSNYTVQEIVEKGVTLARQACEGKDVKVALAIGPLSTLLEPFGTLKQQEAYEIFKEMIDAGVKAKPDLIMIQTFIDLKLMEIAVDAAKTSKLPIYSTLSFQKKGKTIMGDSIEKVCETLEKKGVDAIGLNCSLGPELALPLIKRFKENSKLPIIFKPNAGMPITRDDGSTFNNFTVDSFIKEIKLSLDYVDYIGGCCGCNKDYILALNSLLKEKCC